MKAVIISDKEFQNALYQKLKKQTTGFLIDKVFETETIDIGREDLAFCMGCFGCWIEKPGECVINDKISQINRKFINSDVVIYLNPVTFGQFSANIKNAIDRWLPNILPFFIRRPDGSTMHPSRYDSLPKQIIIGYGEDLSEDDIKLFIDIIEKHRRNIEVLIYQNNSKDISEELNKINLEKVGKNL